MPISLPNFENTRILVAGDLMLDRYLVGDTARMSPEAPVPVVHVDDCQNHPGGAANVAVTCATLGSQVSCLGIVGNDRDGEQLKTLLTENRVNHELVIDNVNTIVKSRIISRRQQYQQLLRLDYEETFSDDAANSLYQCIIKHLEWADLLIISDYDKGSLVNIEQLILQAKELKIPILVDPKAKKLSAYAGATLVKPNRDEFNQVVGHSCDERSDYVAVAKQQMKQNDIDYVLITLGADGMLFVPASGEYEYYPARVRQVFDVTGAGDTVIGVLGSMYAAGESFFDAVAVANIAAGIAVSRPGIASVTKTEIESVSPFSSGDSLFTRAEDLKVICDQARQKGERLVMTNGCFDLLHVGHLSCLHQARQKGDRLIVAVNDDASVQRNKGSQRPVIPLEQRMQLLSGLSCVDWVVSFAEDTPENLISLIKPDVLVKGGDYPDETAIIGHELVRAYGGEVERLSSKIDVSTSEIIEKITALS